MGMIFRSTTHQSWAADINQFDTRVAVKGIQIHHDERDRRNVVGLEIGHV